MVVVRKRSVDFLNENKSNQHIEERAYVHWCNLFLKSKQFEIESIFDLQDGFYMIILLEILTGCNLLESKVDEDEDESVTNWNIIYKHLDSEGIYLTDYPVDIEDKGRRLQLLLRIVWKIILRYQIYDESISDVMSPHNIDYERASKSLVKWLRSKLPDHPVQNFTTDWADGVALCKLVNAIRPDTIPASMFSAGSNPEMSVRLACTSAEDELGIPELIAPYDIANGKAEEKSMMTYIAIFRSADRMIKRGIKTRTYTSDVSMSESETESSRNKKKKKKPYYGITYQSPRCIAFGAGLRWGQVGRPTDFIVRLNGAQASDLSVSIECRPYDHRSALYKPELQIKPIGESSYVVRYTPTRPGEYVLSIFCGGDHINDSPFRLSVRETVLLPRTTEDIDISLDPAKPAVNMQVLTDSLKRGAKREDSAFVDDDNLSESSGSPPMWLEEESRELYTKLERFGKPSDTLITAHGEGLTRGEVGVVGKFTVTTPNTDRGPLRVNITCPAMSIPVPCVKTKLEPTFLSHEVLFTPTEPGIYEIEVHWGDKPIKGSPFPLTVTDSEAQKELVNDEKCKQVQSFRNKSEMYLYYSVTSKNLVDHYYKEQMVKVLTDNCTEKLSVIAADIEMSSSERKELFDMANCKQLPLLVVNDGYAGDYDLIMQKHNEGGLAKHLQDVQYPLSDLSF